jgi:hypothetical protein
MNWLQPDPAQFAGGNANFYRAMSGNPTRYGDPLGLASIEINGSSWIQNILNNLNWKVGGPTDWKNIKAVETWLAGLPGKLFGGPGDVLLFLTLVWLEPRLKRVVVSYPDDTDDKGCCKFHTPFDPKLLSIEADGDTSGTLGGVGAGLQGIIAKLLGINKLAAISYTLTFKATKDSTNCKKNPPTMTVWVQMIITVEMLGIKKTYKSLVDGTLICGQQQKNVSITNTGGGKGGAGGKGGSKAKGAVLAE